MKYILNFKILFVFFLSSIIIQAQDILITPLYTSAQQPAGSKPNPVVGYSLDPSVMYPPIGTEGSPAVTTYSSHFNAPYDGVSGSGYINGTYSLNPDWEGTFSTTISAYGEVADSFRVRSGRNWTNSGGLDTFTRSRDNNNAFYASGERFDTTSFAGIGTGNATAIVSYDFSDLADGFLPAGTVLLLEGVDVPGEGISIMSNANSQFLDYIWAGDENYNFAQGVNHNMRIEPVYWNSTDLAYHTNGTGVTQSRPTSIFRTNQAINSLELTVTTSPDQDPTYRSLGYGQSVGFSIFAPTVPVPEPSGALLLGAAGLFCILRRRRA